MGRGGPEGSALRGLRPRGCPGPLRRGSAGAGLALLHLPSPGAVCLSGRSSSPPSPLPLPAAWRLPGPGGCGGGRPWPCLVVRRSSGSAAWAGGGRETDKQTDGPRAQRLGGSVQLGGGGRRRADGAVREGPREKVGVTPEGGRREGAGGSAGQRRSRRAGRVVPAVVPLPAVLWLQSSGGARRSLCPALLSGARRGGQLLRHGSRCAPVSPCSAAVDVLRSLRDSIVLFYVHEGLRGFQNGKRDFFF